VLIKKLSVILLYYLFIRIWYQWRDHSEN